MPWYGSHTYLNEYIVENKCRKIMEIGVYNGENAASMIKAAKRNFPPEEIEYHGFDFFSYYGKKYVEKKLEKTQCYYWLYEGNTLESVPKAVLSMSKMDLIFIDGGKSFNVAWSDWRNSSKLMHSKTGVFVHNADFSGVKKMVKKIPREAYSVEVFYSPGEGSVALIHKKLF
jgi:predicted O-methyltransferase YrrM